MANPDATRVFTRDEVLAAVNDAADQARDITGGDERVADLVNLVVNLTMGLLDDPAAEVDTVIAEAYGEDPETVKGWVA